MRRDEEQTTTLIFFVLYIAKPKLFCMVAGGSGITPMLQVIIHSSSACYFFSLLFVHNRMTVTYYHFCN